MKKTEVFAVASSHSGGRYGSGVTLRIEDDRSRNLIVELEMTFEEWGRVTTARYTGGIHANVWPTDKVGLFVDTRSLTMPKGAYNESDEDLTARAKAVAMTSDFAVEGFEYAHHSKTNGPNVQIVMRRYLEEPPEAK